MVRSATFEIRWHDTQPIYSCSFQPLSSTHLRRVLEHNHAQAQGLSADKILANVSAAAGAAAASATVSAGAHPGAGAEEGTAAAAAAVKDAAAAANAMVLPMLAGGQSWRLATAGGDNNARVSPFPPFFPYRHPAGCLLSALCLFGF